MSKILRLSKTFRRFSSGFVICRRKSDGSLEEAVFPVKNAVDLVRAANLKVAMNVENEKVYSEISTANFIVKTDVIGCISSLNLKNEKSGYGILVEMGEDNWGKSQKYFFSITDEELDLLDRDYLSLNFTFDVIEYFSKSRGNSLELRAVNLKEIKN